MKHSPTIIFYCCGVAVICAIACVFGAAPESATSDPYIEAPVTSCRVIDGDTVEVSVTLTLPLRLRGVDAPELRVAEQKTAGVVAKQETQRWVDAATGDGHKLLIRAYRLGQFGRMEGDLRDRHGHWLSEHLLARGVVVTSGESRHKWTKDELTKIEGTK